MGTFIAASLLACLVWIAPGHAQSWIELTEVPPRIHGLLNQGRNLVVTAAIHGEVVEEVWLALADDVANTEPSTPGSHVPLTRTGERIWQINLTSHDARELLTRHGMGELAVFARPPGEPATAKVISSIPVQFAVRPALELPRLAESVATPKKLKGNSDWSGKLHIESKQPDSLDHRGSEQGSTQTIKSYSIGPGRTFWADPTTTDKIRIASIPVPASAGSCQIGSQTWELQQNNREAFLRLNPEIREAWLVAGVLTIRLARDRRVILRSTPATFPVSRAHKLRIDQRQRINLPTSDTKSAGWLALSLGDITSGQVAIEVRTAQNDLVLQPVSVRLGDEKRFRHLDGQYRLRVLRLHDPLLGRDFAEVRFEQLDTDENGPR